MTEVDVLKAQRDEALREFEAAQERLLWYERQLALARAREEVQRRAQASEVLGGGES